MAITHTLVLYFLLDGKMQVEKIKQATPQECAIKATTFTMSKPANGMMVPVHAECVTKEKKPPKAARALDTKWMT